MENNNPFKKLGQPPKEVPIDLKAKVLNDVAAIKLVMETANLFSSNYSKAIASFFEKRKYKKED